MAKIESYPLPPINFGTTIREADRSAVYGIIGKELNSILNGAESYYPDAGRKDIQTSHSELKSFIADLQKLQGDVNDPSNILTSVLSDLGHIQKALEKTMEDEKAFDDAIQMKPEFAPNSSDSNILDPDRFQDWVKAPLAPRDISFQQAEARSQGRNLNDRSLMFQGPDNRAVNDTTGWQNGMLDSSLVPVSRLVPSQEQGNIDFPAVMRSFADQGPAASAAPAPSDDMNKLLKLRAIVQTMGGRGIFPIQ